MLQLLCLAAQFVATPTPEPPQKHRAGKVEIFAGMYTDNDLTKLSANVTISNARAFRVTAYPIDAVRWFTHPQLSGTRPKPAGAAIWSVSRTVTGNGSQSGQGATYQMDTNLPKTAPGTYLVVFDAKGAETWSVSTLTNMSLTVRRSYGRTLVWATDRDSGRLIAGAGVKIVGPTGAFLAGGKTGRDGAWLQNVKTGKGFVVVSNGNDVVGVQTEVSNPNGSLKCLLITDRPIYRPGQNIHFKGIARLTDGQGYRVAANKPVNVLLRNDQGIVTDRQSLTTNGLGAVSGSFSLPRSAALNDYTLELSLGGQTEYHQITVQEYRKPEFQVTVTGGKARYFAGQDIRFRINAGYYFGAPVGQAQVNWVVVRTPKPLVPAEPIEDAGFRYAYNDGFPILRRQPVTTGTAATDARGNLDVTVHTKPGEPDGEYALTANVIDSSRRAVEGTGSVSCYAAALRIGLSAGSQVVSLGQSIPVEVRVTDDDGKDVDADVEISAYPYRYDAKAGWIRSARMVRVYGRAHDGKATLRIAALKGGQIEIVASTIDRNGRKATASTFTYVEDASSRLPAPKEQPYVRIKLDKITYRPGDTVKALITTNRPGRPILLVESGGDLWGYRVVETNGRSAVASFATGKQFSPTLILSASLPDVGQVLQAQKQISLPDPNRTLKVAIVPGQKEYRPGDPAGLRISTTDAHGHGVPADLAIGVADESLYSLAADNNVEPVDFFWGGGEDRVVSFNERTMMMQKARVAYFLSESSDVAVAAPKSMGYGGAFGGSISMGSVSLHGTDMSGFAAIQQKIRKAFQDTAYWNAFVETDASGHGAVKFDLPDDLGSWRASGAATTASTRVGSGHTTFVATRPVTFRLSAPRVIAKGDQLTMIGTVNNRTGKDQTYDVNLEVAGARLDGDTTRSVFVKAHDAATVNWKIGADELPATGQISFTGKALAQGATSAEDGDAVQIKVPVMPRGVMQSGLSGGTMEREKEVSIDVPADAMAQGSTLTVILSGGLHSRIRELAHDLINTDPYGTLGAVDMLKGAIAVHADARSDAFREAYAELSKTYGDNGWGWWANCPASPVITAEVGYTLGLAAKAGYRVDGQLKQFAAEACSQLYPGTNRWEGKCRLAVALSILGASSAPARLRDVLAHGQHLSPFAKLRLAEALGDAGLISGVLPLVSDGPDATFLPVGDDYGWSASSTQTTAELLLALRRFDLKPDLQSKLARWLAMPAPGDWRCDDDNADLVRALASYASSRKDAANIGEAHVTVNGHVWTLGRSIENNGESIEIPNALVPGANTFSLSRSGEGEVFYTIRTQVVRPDLGESVQGVRVSRRFEAKNAAGIWSEITKPIAAGAEVRCTMVVWGDDIPDAIRVTEPVPAGFEFIQDDPGATFANEEQRDGRMVHYFINSGSPIVLSYFLRAETDGSLVALPAVAEYLRRPAVQGHSASTQITVKP